MPAATAPAHRLLRCGDPQIHLRSRATCADLCRRRYAVLLRLAVRGKPSMVCPFAASRALRAREAITMPAPGAGALTTTLAVNGGLPARDTAAVGGRLGVRWRDR